MSRSPIDEAILRALRAVPATWTPLVSIDDSVQWETIEQLLSAGLLEFEYSVKLLDRNKGLAAVYMLIGQGCLEGRGDALLSTLLEYHLQDFDASKAEIIAEDYTRLRRTLQGEEALHHSDGNPAEEDALIRYVKRELLFDRPGSLGMPPACAVQTATVSHEAKRRISQSEANAVAPAAIKRHCKRTSEKMTVDQLATEIGSSRTVAAKTPAWKAYSGAVGKGKGRSPGKVSITKEVEKSLGDSDDPLEKMCKEEEKAEELARFLEKPDLDYMESPLSSTGKRRRVRPQL